MGYSETVPRVYLGLGSNLGDRAGNLLDGLAALSEVGHVGACSSVYESEPWGDTDQPPFLNLCCALDTDLAPLDLLDQAQRAEQRLGRVPSRRWGPRTLDIDLLVLPGTVFDHPRLRIPHPFLARRAFVLVPLAEIAPDLRVTGLHTADDPAVRGDGSRGTASPFRATGVTVRALRDDLLSRGTTTSSVQWVAPPPALYDRPPGAAGTSDSSDSSAGPAGRS
ncbi:MAG: 2-amino-4-hydroxy-6-hydroxymethyldihydropteridine diphosphokinase [Chloroflexi bacterium]|nr:2-amino-4-hydroxy-6-hydroxymethyldihydropteridine diphosphokinase [Chloroflexota bacterium]